MSNLNGGLSGSGTLRGTLGGGGVPAQDVYWDDILNKPNFAAVATSGSYNDLVNKPNLANVATSGSYNDLTDKPTIPAAQVNADWNATSGVAEILNKPTIPAAQVNADWNATSGVAEILNKPTLAPVATSGSYNDLTNTPTIPPAQVNADWNAASGVAAILNKPTIPTTAAQIDYDNTTSGIQADDVQDAITELKSNLTDKYEALGAYTQIGSLPYTATEDGFVVLNLTSGQASATQYCYGTINDVELLCTLSMSGAHDTACAPIKKGEILKATAVSQNAITKWYFKPLKTSNN